MNTEINKFNKQRREDLRNYLENYRDVFEKNKHLSLERIADELNRQNIKTKQGSKWYPGSVGRAMDVLNIRRVRY